MAKRLVTAFIFCSQLFVLSAQEKSPDTVTIRSGSLNLKALLWCPAGKGIHPAIIFCHGGYESTDTTYDVVENVSGLGRIFAKHGYIFLGLFRRGTGLSKNTGKNGADLMAEALKKHGQSARNKVQLEQLETTQLSDMIAGLKFLRKRNDVDTNRMGVVGHSFGGSLALLVAEHESSLNAVIIFSAAGYSWDRSPELRERLLEAVRKIQAPVMIIHAQNDYSINPGLGIDTALTILHKKHFLKIYPSFGTSNRDAHNLIILGPEIWQEDVFRFLDKWMKKK